VSGDVRPPDAQAEARRIAAEQRHAIIEAPEEEAFDRLCALARDVLDTPLAAVALIAGEGEWVKARQGLTVHEWPRAWAFHPHFTDRPRAGGCFIVPDAHADDRFRHNPLVVSGPRLRFLAGAPLCAPGGEFLGTMAVASPEPRPAGLTERQRQHLASLAALAADELELRLQRRRAQDAAAEAAAEAVAAREARAAEARLRAAHEGAGAVALEIAAGGAMGGATGRLRDLLGLPHEVPVTFQAVSARLRAEDRAGFDAEATRLLRQGGAFLLEVELAPRAGDGRRWIELRGTAEPPTPAGHGRILGVAMDVTARREAAERVRLLSHEVDHRTANALAVVQATLRTTRAPDIAGFTALVEGRVAALAQVQRLLARDGWAAIDLEQLVAAQLAGAGPGMAWEGPRIAIGHTAAQPLGMAVHELVLNARQHGALSAASGRATLRWWIEADALRLSWTESGGPAVVAPARRGFGLRMIEATLRGQLRGAVTWHWNPGGLRCEMSAPRERVAEQGMASGTGTG
jgi:two-component sensor histidine kinase